MKLKLLIVDLEIPPRVKRMALRLGVAGLVVGGGAGVAWAAMPHNFSAGETLRASELNENFAAMETRLAGLEAEQATLKADRDALQARLDAVEDSDSPCPAGYTQDASKTEFILCKKGNDEVVKVGAGGGAFWIDRYEASVWSDAAGSDVQFGVASDDYPGSFPKNGQWKTSVLYAVSRAGVKPSASLTWFQAAAACRASGKRLPNGEEWLAAARGTEDDAGCNVSSSAPRNAGSGASCQSSSGAEDMIGNVHEWTSEWYASPPASSSGGTDHAWPSGFGDDGTYGVASSSYTLASGNNWVTGLPSAAFRGGGAGAGSRGGMFYFDIGASPSMAAWYVGFRCVLPR